MFKIHFFIKILKKFNEKNHSTVDPQLSISFCVFDGNINKIWIIQPK